MSLVNKKVEILAEYVDRYGEKQILHKTKFGIRKFQGHSTPQRVMTAVSGELMGERIRARREALGMSLEVLALKAGLAAGPGQHKCRMWEIERGVRGGGVRFGTLYCLAIALECEVIDLIPTIEEATEAMKRHGLHRVEKVVSTFEARRKP